MGIAGKIIPANGNVIQIFYSATIKQSDKDKEKEIMQEAARLIKSDILSMPQKKKNLIYFMI